MTFTIYFNKDYMEWANVLIKSINIIEPTAIIAAHYINIKFEESKKLIEYSNTFVIEHDIKDIINVQMAWQIIENKAKYLMETIKLFPDDLHIMIDTDMMLINPIDVLKSQMKDFDMAGIRINKNKIAGGFLAVRPTAMSMNLLRKWSKYLLDDQVYYFNKDQPSLARYCELYIAKGLKWLDVSRQYLDHLEKDDSMIWSAHKTEYGIKKERIKKYKKKLEEMYENRSN